MRGYFRKDKSGNCKYYENDCQNKSYCQDEKPEFGIDDTFGNNLASDLAHCHGGKADDEAGGTESKLGLFKGGNVFDGCGNSDG